MMNKKLIASLSLVPWAAMLAFLPFPESFSERVEAFPSQQVPVEYENQIIGSVEMPDWNYFSFSDFEPVLTSGSINSSEYDVNEVGYDLSRQWASGDRIESILTLGDLEEIMDAQQFSLDNISQITGDDLSLVSLDQFPLLGQSTLSELVNTIPQWQNLNLRVKNVPALAKLLNGQTIPGIKAGPNQRVAKVLKIAKFANLSFSQMSPEMQQTLNITQVTGASSVPLENYKGWENQKLDQIPGLKKVPLSKMPSALVPEIAGIARIDALWGTEEAKRYRTITGSYQQGFQVPCNEKCAYLELDDIEGTGRTIRSEFEGKQWISGKYQKVNGGSGCLKMVNGGKEPTGRHPFGKAFKVSLEDTFQSDDTAQTALYFRIKVKCGATPYFLGPFPFLKVQRDGWIIY